MFYRAGQSWFAVYAVCACMLWACRAREKDNYGRLVAELKLKTGPVISCGPPDAEFGLVDFPLDFGADVKKVFNEGMELLHSFEYDEAEKAFAQVIRIAPDCAMAYWGIAMCSFHPLWEAPTPASLQKGARALAIADSVARKKPREADYLHAVAAYYNDWEHSSAPVRNQRFVEAMQNLRSKYPADREAAIFYCLALDAAAKPGDSLYTNQKLAGRILDSIYAIAPNHPGIIHYIIHTYDYPGLARLGLPAAKRYAEVAPSSAHALHMPSHIFTRLGEWEDCIHSNLASVNAATCYAQSAALPGHWDEELHGQDYLAYAYLQRGDNAAARSVQQSLDTFTRVYPANFKVAYAFAAIACRAALENHQWQQAATVRRPPIDFPWTQFPWQQAIFHFTRLMGAAHTGNLSLAMAEKDTLHQLQTALQQQGDAYKAMQVAIQLKTGEAWMALLQQKNGQALDLMAAAADMEDHTSKHPVTPGEVLPARELYADMLLQQRQPAKALREYERVLAKSPNRFNSLFGAGYCAMQTGDRGRAVQYFKTLTAICVANSDRPELREAAEYLKNMD